MLRKLGQVYQTLISLLGSRLIYSHCWEKPYAVNFLGIIDSQTPLMLSQQSAASSSSKQLPSARKIVLDAHKRGCI